ncbi:MAG: hypothetical protein K2Y27_33160 [Xanthobacteraceae bacterium]|nr:hypothetical protein [Xanthobacteraceae bacterium]
MSHTIFRTSQDLTALHFDVSGHCYRALASEGSGQRAHHWWPRRTLVPQSLHSAARHAEQSAHGRAPQSLREQGKPGTLLPFLSLLLGIAVSADVGRAS